MKKYTRLILLLILILFAHLSLTQQNPKIEITKIAPNLYKFHRFPVSFLAFVGPEGVLISDMAGIISKEQLLSELTKLGNNNVKYIINTHWHHDHTYGNKLFGKSATIISHESVKKWLSEDQELAGETFNAFPEYAIPDLTFSSELTLHFNGEIIEMIHLPNCHTDGDFIVYFRNANILHVGDIIISDFMFPIIDVDRGGSVQQLAGSLQKIIEIMPQDVKIIPGHIKGEYIIEDLKKIRNMILSTVNIVRQEIIKGKSLEEIKNARILEKWKDWENPMIKCGDWIEYIFHDLNSQIEGG